MGWVRGGWGDLIWGWWRDGMGEFDLGVMERWGGLIWGW